MEQAQLINALVLVKRAPILQLQVMLQMLQQPHALLVLLEHTVIRPVFKQALVLLKLHASLERMLSLVLPHLQRRALLVQLENTAQQSD